MTDPNLAYAATIAGVLGIYGEFCLPGRVIPGVVGGVLATLGIASLAAMAVRVDALLWFALGAAMLAAGAKYLWIAGALAMSWGAAHLVPGMNAMLAAALTLPFAAISVTLLRIAIRARENKSIPELS